MLDVKGRQLILLLIKPVLTANEEEELLELLRTHMDWSAIMGMITTHRITGVAYQKVITLAQKHQFNDFAYNKFINFLRDMYHLQSSRVTVQLSTTLEVAEWFNEAHISYVVLKGVALTQGIYKDRGSRNFNDVDILVHPNDIQRALEVLKREGYIQGDYNSCTGAITAVPRKELVIRPMVSHEVIPLIRVSEQSPFVPIQEIDLQFSIDLMTSNRTDQLVNEFLSRRIEIEADNRSFYSLSWEDHFIFLCVHFYKEATTDFEVNLYNDLSLYKLCDIANLLLSSDISIDRELVLSRAAEYSLDKALNYTLHYVREIFGENVVQLFHDACGSADTAGLHEVYRYNKNEIALEWSSSIIERVFDMNRAGSIPVHE